MDRFRTAELELRMQHRHSDGAWGTLQPRPMHHDAADHDPERDWENGRLYVCTTCDEEVRVAPADGGPRDR